MPGWRSRPSTSASNSKRRLELRRSEARVHQLQRDVARRSVLPREVHGPHAAPSPSKLSMRYEPIDSPCVGRQSKAPPSEAPGSGGLRKSPLPVVLSRSRITSRRKASCPSVSRSTKLARSPTGRSSARSKIPSHQRPRSQVHASPLGARRLSACQARGIGSPADIRFTLSFLTVADLRAQPRLPSSSRARRFASRRRALARCPRSRHSRRNASPRSSRAPGRPSRAASRAAPRSIRSDRSVRTLRESHRGQTLHGSPRASARRVSARGRSARAASRRPPRPRSARGSASRPVRLRACASTLRG